MAKFVNSLHVSLLHEAEGGVWQLEEPLCYRSDVIGTILVPKGFVTDFASVPRLPVTYWLTGNTAHAAAVVHDFLYSPKCKDTLTRKQADDVFYEASIVSGVPVWRAKAMWVAVRTFGGQFWRAK